MTAYGQGYGRAYACGKLSAAFFPDIADNAAVRVAGTGTVKSNLFATVIVSICYCLVRSGICVRYLIRGLDRNNNCVGGSKTAVIGYRQLNMVILIF